MKRNCLNFGVTSLVRSRVLVRAISLVLGLAPVTSALAAGVVLVLCLLSGAPLNAQGLTVSAGLSADYPPLSFGRKVSFHLIVRTNTGEASLSNVTAAINLPPGVNFIAASTGTPLVTGTAATGEQLTIALGGTRFEGDLVQITVSVDNSVADGTKLPASFQVSGQALNTPFTVSGAVQFQIGFLPVEIFVEDYSADSVGGGVSSSQSGFSNDFFVKNSSDGSPITGAVNGPNGAFASGGCSGPNVSLPLVFVPPAAIFQNKVGEITSANSSVTVTGLGNFANAIGGYDTVIIQTGGGPVTQFFPAHSEASGCQYNIKFLFRSPNPYRPALIIDDRRSSYSAAGNEEATDPISGVIFGFPGSTMDPIVSTGSGQGRATHTVFHRLLSTPTKGTLRVVESFTCFPEEQSFFCAGSPPSDTTQTFRSTLTPAPGPIEYFTGLKPASAKAESRFAFNDDGTISLIRSGYGVVTGAQSITFMRGDANIGDFDASNPAQLVFTGNSPIGLLVTDAQGHRIGFNPPPNPPPAHVDARPTVVAEILGASYSGVDTHPQVIKLPDPKPGSYQVKVTGRGTGSFSLTMETLTVNGGLIDRETTTGNASPGSSASFNLNVTAAGRLSMGGAPPADTVPVANAGPDQTVECSSHMGTPVTLDGSKSSDPDGDPLTFKWTDKNGNVIGTTAVINRTLPLGAFTFNLRVTDPGGLSSTATTHVTVRDTTPPALSVSLSPNVLWPPNHKFVPITASIQVSDICDPNPRVTLVSITSNEPLAPNDVQGAVIGTDTRSFLLRAERLGTGTGRVYAVRYRAMDASGNMTFATAQVMIPHDQGQRARAAKVR